MMTNDNTSNAISGHYMVKHFDDTGKLLSTVEGNNSITYSGVNTMLNVNFRPVATGLLADGDLSDFNTWYIGLLEQQLNYNQTPMTTNTSITLTYEGNNLQPFVDTTLTTLLQWNPSEAVLIPKEGENVWYGKVRIKSAIQQVIVSLPDNLTKKTIVGMYVTNRPGKTLTPTDEIFDLLWSTMLFDAPIEVKNNHYINISYWVDIQCSAGV